MSFDPTYLYLSLVAILLIMIVSFALTRYLTGRREAKLHAEIAVLYEKFGLPIPISTAFQTVLVKQMTHYHTPEMDGLMKKIGPPNTLTEAEEHRLTILLKERTQDMGSEITPSERDAAAILPMVMKRARIEADTLAGAEALKLRLVTVAAVVGLPINVAAETERDA